MGQRPKHACKSRRAYKRTPGKRFLTLDLTVTLVWDKRHRKQGKMDRLASGGLKVCAGKDARTLCAEQEDKPQSERRDFQATYLIRDIFQNVVSGMY